MSRIRHPKGPAGTVTPLNAITPGVDGGQSHGAAPTAGRERREADRLPRARFQANATLPSPLGKAVNEAAQVIAQRTFRTEQARLRAVALEMLDRGKTPEDVQRWLVTEAFVTTK